MRQRGSLSPVWLALPALLVGALGCDSLRALGAPEAPLWLHHPGSALSIELRRPLTAETRQLGEKYERGRPEIDPAHPRAALVAPTRGQCGCAAYLSNA